MVIDRKAFLKKRLLGHLQRLPQVAEEFRANPSQKNFNDVMELFPNLRPLMVFILLAW